MRANLWAVGGLVLLSGCNAPVPPPDPAETLRKAVIHCHSEWCGTGHRGADYQQALAVIRAASDDERMTAYTAVVNSAGVNDFCVGSVTSAATKLPFNAKFRHALRGRRDELKEAKRRAIAYFAKYGDESDLKWMDEAEQSMRDLRQRLTGAE